MFQSLLGFGDLEGVYWTLGFELRFYILMTVVIALRGMPYIDILLGAWLATSIVADFIEVPDIFRSLFALGWAHYFVAGALAWRMRARGMCMLRLGLFILAGLQALRHALWYMALKVKLTGADYHTEVVILLVLAMFLLFLGLAIRRIGAGHTKLEPLGRITYPLYLAHATIGHLLNNRLLDVGVNKWVILGITTTLSLIAAWAIARWIEPPLADWLRRKTETALVAKQLG